MNIADRYIALREQAKAIEAEMEAIKKEFLALGIERLAADDYSLALVHQLGERRTLDRKLLAQHVSKEILARCEKVTEYASVTVREHVVAKAA